MAIAKKKIKMIENIMLFDDILKKYDCTEEAIQKTHWLDTPPEMWNKTQHEKWDMMNELEMALKKKVLEILTPTP